MASDVWRGDSLSLLGYSSGSGFVNPWHWRVEERSVSVIGRARREACAIWEERIPSRSTSSLVMALVAGERRLLPESVREAFRESGAYHLIAVSGFHVALLAGVLYGILSGLARVRGWWLVGGVLLLVWLYCLFAGARASTLRSAAMLSGLLIARELLGRRPSGLLLWSLAGILVIVVDPEAVHDRAAWMSFLAVLALIVTGEGLLRFSRGVLGMSLGILGAGVVVTISIAPIVMDLYGSVRLHGPLATLISMLFLLPLFVLGLLVLVPLVWPAAARLAEWLAFLWLEVLDLLGLEGLRVSGPAALSVWAMLVLVMLLFRKGPERVLRRFR
jgi:competence protein ComEC